MDKEFATAGGISIGDRDRSAHPVEFGMIEILRPEQAGVRAGHADLMSPEGFNFRPGQYQSGLEGVEDFVEVIGLPIFGNIFIHLNPILSGMAKNFQFSGTNVQTRHMLFQSWADNCLEIENWDLKIYTQSMQRGLFITFEGIDGSGKTTQLKRLAARLVTSNIPHVVTREPGGSEAGERIRQIIIESTKLALEPKAEVYLFLANRVQNLAEVVVPAVEAGQIVLSDRHRDSSAAFQGGGRQLGYEITDALQDYACAALAPDCTLYIDISVEESRKRAAAREQNAATAKTVDRFEREGMAFHQRIWEGYQWLIKKYPARFLVIDGSGNEDAVEQLVWAALAARYPDYFGIGSHLLITQ